MSHGKQIPSETYPSQAASTSHVPGVPTPQETRTDIYLVGTESRPAERHLHEGGLPTTQPAAETETKYYQPVPGRTHQKEEVVEKRKVFVEKIEKEPHHTRIVQTEDRPVGEFGTGEHVHTRHQAGVIHDIPLIHGYAEESTQPHMRTQDHPLLITEPQLTKIVTHEPPVSESSISEPRHHIPTESVRHIEHPFQELSIQETQPTESHIPLYQYERVHYTPEEAARMKSTIHTHKVEYLSSEGTTTKPQYPEKVYVSEKVPLSKCPQCNLENCVCVKEKGKEVKLAKGSGKSKPKHTEISHEKAFGEKPENMHKLQIKEGNEGELIVEGKKAGIKRPDIPKIHHHERKPMNKDVVIASEYPTNQTEALQQIKNQMHEKSSEAAMGKKDKPIVPEPRTENIYTVPPTDVVSEHRYADYKYSQPTGDVQTLIREEIRRTPYEVFEGIGYNTAPDEGKTEPSMLEKVQQKGKRDLKALGKQIRDVFSGDKTKSHPTYKTYRFPEGFIELTPEQVREKISSEQVIHTAPDTTLESVHGTESFKLKQTKPAFSDKEDTTWENIISESDYNQRLTGQSDIKRTTKPSKQQVVSKPALQKVKDLKQSMNIKDQEAMKFSKQSVHQTGIKEGSEDTTQSIAQGSKELINQCKSSESEKALAGRGEDLSKKLETKEKQPGPARGKENVEETGSKGLVQTVKETASEYVSKAAETLSSVYQTVTSSTEETKESTSEKIKEMSENVQAKAKETGQKVSETYQGMKEGANEKGQQAVETIKSTGQQMKERPQPTGQKVKESTQEKRQKVTEPTPTLAADIEKGPHLLKPITEHQIGKTAPPSKNVKGTWTLPAPVKGQVPPKSSQKHKPPTKEDFEGTGIYALEVDPDKGEKTLQRMYKQASKIGNNRPMKSMKKLKNKNKTKEKEKAKAGKPDIMLDQGSETLPNWSTIKDREKGYGKLTQKHKSPTKEDFEGTGIHDLEVDPEKGEKTLQRMYKQAGKIGNNRPMKSMKKLKNKNKTKEKEKAKAGRGEIISEKIDSTYENKENIENKGIEAKQAGLKKEIQLKESAKDTSQQETETSKSWRETIKETAEEIESVVLEELHLIAEKASTAMHKASETLVEVKDKLIETIEETAQEFASANRDIVLQESVEKNKELEEQAIDIAEIGTELTRKAVEQGAIDMSDRVEESSEYMRNWTRVLQYERGYGGRIEDIEYRVEKPKSTTENTEERLGQMLQKLHENVEGMKETMASGLKSMLNLGSTSKSESGREHKEKSSMNPPVSIQKINEQSNLQSKGPKGDLSKDKPQLQGIQLSNLKSQPAYDFLDEFMYE